MKSDTLSIFINCLSIAIIGTATALISCDTAPKAIPDSGVTSVSMDMTLKSNEVALKRADEAIHKAAAANDQIKATIPLIAKESQGQSHTKLWSHANTIENASMTIGSSLEDIHSNQVDLAKQSKEVKKKERDLEARAIKLAEIEAMNVERILGTLRLAMIFGGVLFIGGFLIGWITGSKMWGGIISGAGFIMGIGALAISIKYKELADIGFYLILACIAVMVVGGIIMVLRGRKDEIRDTVIGELFSKIGVDHMDLANLTDEQRNIVHDSINAYKKKVKK